MNPFKPHSLNVPTRAAASLVFESATCIIGINIVNYVLYALTCIRVLTTSAGWVTRLAMIPAPE